MILMFGLNNKKMILCMLIIWHLFKFINKTYGVEVGDILLYQVGQYLQQELEKIGSCFRFGSDQFSLVIPKKDIDIRDISEKINKRFKHPWFYDSNVAIMMSATITCIECPKEANNYSELIDKTDYINLYAKKNNKGTIVMIEDVELDNIITDKAVEKAVRTALDTNGIMVYYQPIYNVVKKKYASAEALVRINDKKLGWISPEKFIPITEKNGMIIELGDIIFESVCRFISGNNLNDTSIEYIDVNISAVQMMQPNYALKLIACMEKYNVSPSQIIIEITETATMAATAVVNDNIGILYEYGIKFSLDDYGSGSANVSYINRMPFDIIKLDKQIIWDAFKNSKAGITLEYTIKMLNALNLFIVAEGVETFEMQDYLKNAGCQFMQGWYYSKAVPEKEFLEIIKQPNV